MYKVTKDFELQSKYDAIVNTPSKESFLLKRFDPFKEDEFYFVSGQNGYFNEHIDKNGLNNIRVEDKDAKVIATLYSLALTFGKPENYGKYDSIIYITPPGTLELGYARQSFPSGILEEVLRWEGDRKYPYPWFMTGEGNCVDIIVGEEEYDYWTRVARELLNIKKKSGEPLKINDDEISDEQIDNFMTRVRSVFKKFCKGSNRLYFLPISQILNNKATWFAENIREGSITREDYESTIEKMETLEQMANSVGKDPNSFHNSLKSSKSKWGIALLGEINGPIKYVDIKTTYQLLQEYFKNHGHKDGEVVDYKTVYRLFEEREYPEEGR